MALRKRRTPEEARDLVLTTAESRLKRSGLDGLNIGGVAEEAGISHGTVIHHFGSTAGMRRALVERMTERLILDVVDALERDVEPAVLLRDLFTTFADGGHGRLLAWLAVEEGDGARAGHARDLFAALLDTLQARLGGVDPSMARHVVLLVAMAAVGYGIAGDVLQDVLGMSETELADFPRWLAEHIV